MVLNNSRDENGKNLIDVLRPCAVVTPDFIYDSRYFENITVQAEALSVMTVEADRYLSRFSNYRDLSPDLKQSVLYLHHNLPAVAEMVVKNINLAHPKTEKTLFTLIQGRKDAAMLKGMMEGNPRVYGDIKKMTPSMLMQRFLEQTKVGAQIVANADEVERNPAFRAAMESRAIGDYMRQFEPPRSVIAAPAKPKNAREHLSKTATVPPSHR